MIYKKPSWGLPLKGSKACRGGIWGGRALPTSMYYFYIIWSLGWAPPYLGPKIAIPIHSSLIEFDVVFGGPRPEIFGLGCRRAPGKPQKSPGEPQGAQESFRKPRKATGSPGKLQGFFGFYLVLAPPGCSWLFLCCLGVPGPPWVWVLCNRGNWFFAIKFKKT